MELLVLIFETGLKALPITLIIGGLAAWLGKVWAARISRIEQQSLQKEIDSLRSSLDLQKSLLLQAQQGANVDHAVITREQLEAVKQFWNHWLDFRSELGKFHTPHQILTVAELNNIQLFRKNLFPYGTEEINQSLKAAMGFDQKIERLRPMLPMQIYQHFKGVSMLYLRIALHLSTELPKDRMIAWYQNSSGEIDHSVTALMAYGKSVSLLLPDPQRRNDTYRCFSEWRELLEEKLSELIYHFVNGSLDRQIVNHEAIRKLSAESARTE